MTFSRPPLKQRATWGTLYYRKKPPTAAATTTSTVTSEGLDSVFSLAVGSPLAEFHNRFPCFGTQGFSGGFEGLDNVHITTRGRWGGQRYTDELHSII